MADVYDITGAFQDIEMELIKSMKRTMKRHIGEEMQEGINWSQWQAEMLNGLAQYKEENRDKLPNYFSTINDEIDEAIRQAYASGESEQEIELLEAIKNGYKVDKAGKGTNSMQGAFFKVNDEKLNALIKSTTQDMQRAESAILRMTDDVYRQTIFKAQMFYNTGASTLWKAVDMATKDFLSAGINCVEYKNGARVNIASYSEMALRTANKRANLMGSANKRMEYGLHTVKVSSHNSACPMCIQWQGKVYYDDVYGSVMVQEKLGIAGFKKYPLLSEAVKGGMFHPNCKNGCSTYYEGINQEPKEPTKEEKEEMLRRYNLEQEQRLCERNIRKYKRLESGSLDADNVAHYADKRKQWTHKYNELIINNTDVLRADPARLKLYGITATDLKPATNAVKATATNILFQPVTTTDTAYDKVLTGLKNRGIGYNPVIDHLKKMDDAEIIGALAGGDNTKGSCASVALAYIGQKQGWNVLDFRDGTSRDFFSSSLNLRTLSDAKGVKVLRADGASSLTVGNRLLKQCEIGKEYYLCVGRHASIVRKTEDGLQYLELQSARNSGWSNFDKNARYTLSNRFGCSSRSDYGASAHYDFMIDITDSDFSTDEFKSVLGYLNTSASEQRKGKYGTIK